MVNRFIADTEARENHAQQIVGGKFACDFAARVLGEAQVFGEKLDLVVVAEGGVFQLGFGFVQGVEVAACGRGTGFRFRPASRLPATARV